MTPSLPMIVLAALAAVTLWGGTPVVTKVAVASIDPLLVGMLRAVLALPVTAAVLLLFGVARPRNAAAWLQIGAAALCVVVLFPVLFSLGQQRTSATHAGLVMALLPVLTGLFAALGARQWPAGRWLLGAGIAFVGAVWLIALRGDSGTAQASAAGDLLVLASSVAASAGYVIGATQAQRIGTLPVALWSVLLGGVVLLPVAVLVWPAGTLARATPAGWLSLLYLALCSSLLAYGLWYWALAAGGVARIGTTQFLQPLVTIALAALLLGERMSAGQGLATAAVLFGVLVCLQARAAAVQRAAPQAMQMGGT